MQAWDDRKQGECHGFRWGKWSSDRQKKPMGGLTHKGSALRRPPAAELVWKASAGTDNRHALTVV